MSDFYDSPSFWFSPEDRRIYALRHLALTNNPASWGRPYLTDHTRNDYGIERASEGRGGARLRLVAASAKEGGSERLNQTLQNLAQNVRSILDRPLTTTGAEMHAAIEKLKESIPNTEVMVFLEEGSESGGATAPATTIADVLAKLSVSPVATIENEGEGKSGEQESAAANPAPTLASQSTATSVPSPILVALGLNSATADEAALAIMNLKATTVPLRDHEQLQQQLRETETATVEERIGLAIAAQRQKGKKILPYLETELKRVAQSNFALAVATLESLPTIDLMPQSDTPAPNVERAAQRKVELPASSGSTHAVASQSSHEETLALMRANPELTYREANEKRLTDKKRQKLAA